MAIYIDNERIIIMNSATKLRKRLDQKRILLLPGIYDALTAKLVRFSGMDAAYLSGACLSMGLLGQPDVGLISFCELLNQARYIVNALDDIPLVVDADTGFGNAINLIRTVRELEVLGVAGVQIEDQVTPKKCGHFEGKQIVSKEEMVLKIEAAKDTRQNPDFLIIARTDARAVLGIDEAIYRAKAYKKAGSDVLFVEAPQSLEEMKKISRELDHPLLANMVEGGKTPMLTVKELEELGFSIALFPGSLQRSAFHAFLKVLDTLKTKGQSESMKEEMISFSLRNEIIGLSHINELEKRYLKYK
jgi:carboxyvinyl-carboxyphosphonate phosphorylmutase